MTAAGLGAARKSYSLTTKEEAGANKDSFTRRTQKLKWLKTKAETQATQTRLASSFALCPRYKSDPGEHIWLRGVLALAKRQSHNST